MVKRLKTAFYIIIWRYLSLMDKHWIPNNQILQYRWCIGKCFPYELNDAVNIIIKTARNRIRDIRIVYRNYRCVLKWIMRLASSQSGYIWPSCFIKHKYTVISTCSNIIASSVWVFDTINSTFWIVMFRSKRKKPQYF